MAQFQVYRVSSERLVLDLQKDLIDTRFPRRRTSNPYFSRAKGYRTPRASVRN